MQQRQPTCAPTYAPTFAGMHPFSRVVGFARRQTWIRPLLALVLCAAALTSASPALADDVLEGTPVVRRNLQYRAGRQEIGALFGSSLGDLYVRNLLPGARYDFHITDWIAIGADVQVGIPVDTVTREQIQEKVSNQNDTFQMEASRIAVLAGGRVSVAPVTGKYMLLGSLPMHYDFHVNLSLGFASTPGIDTLGVGGKKAPSFSLAPGIGAGVRVFLTRVVAITVDLNDVFINRVLAVNRDSQPSTEGYMQHLVLTAGLSFFVPPELKRAD